jgi:hypothetical protein
MCGGTARRTAQAMAWSSSGSSSSAAPPRWRLTVGAGQPKLRSMPAGLSRTSWAALSAMQAGSEPSSWTRTGVPLEVALPARNSGRSA